MNGIGHWTDGTAGNPSPGYWNVVRSGSITQPGPAQPGSCVALAHQNDKRLDAFVTGKDGGVYVAWAVSSEAWNGPFRITNPNLAAAAAVVSAANQTANQLDVFVIGNDGVIWVAWVVGNGTCAGPCASRLGDCPF